MSTRIFGIVRHHATMAASSKILEVHSVDELQETILRQPKCLGAANLAVGDGISLMASFATYGSTTRAHFFALSALETCGTIPMPHVFWISTVQHVAEKVLTPGCQGTQSFAAARARAPVLGCYCERVSNSSFHVGIITQSIDTSGTDLLPVVSEWSSAMFRSTGRHLLQALSVFSELPMCRLQRRARLHVWWESSEERVTPMKPIPPVHATIDHRCNLTSKTQCHRGVRLVSLRPFGSLLGSTAVEITPCDGGVALPPRAEATFSDVAVASEGEHLISVESIVDEDYVPFAPVLVGFISPFRVVSTSDG
jgi:hypothetical protein